MKPNKKGHIKMNCKVLVLSHGKLAGSLLETVEFICGSTAGMNCINMPDPFDQSEYESSIRKTIEENKENGVLVLCDLFGGSPFLTCTRILKEYWEKMEVVTGVNLGMLLELESRIDELDIKELKEVALNAGKQSVIDIKERLGSKE